MRETFRKKCTDKGIIVAVVRYKVSVQQVEIGKADREFRWRIRIR